MKKPLRTVADEYSRVKHALQRLGAERAPFDKEAGKGSGGPKIEPLDDQAKRVQKRIRELYFPEKSAIRKGWRRELSNELRAWARLCEGTTLSGLVREMGYSVIETAAFQEILHRVWFDSVANTGQLRQDARDQLNLFIDAFRKCFTKSGPQTGLGDVVSASRAAAEYFSTNPKPGRKNPTGVKIGSAKSRKAEIALRHGVSVELLDQAIHAGHRISTADPPKAPTFQNILHELLFVEGIPKLPNSQRSGIR